MPTLLHTEPGEYLVHRARVHWGVFILPGLILVALAILDIPLVFLVSSLKQMAGSLQNGSALGMNWFLLVVVALPIFPTLVILGIVTLAYLKSEVMVTNKRLVYRTGFMARISGELLLKNIEALFSEEPILGRMMGYGTVVVTSIGGLQLPFRFIRNPQNFHAALKAAVGTPQLPAEPEPPQRVKAPTQDDFRYMPKA
jgi:hypothetical protein